MAAKKVIKPEYAQISLKIDKDLNEKIEKYWRFNLYQDKTSFIREALDFYINALKCEKCGAMNPKGSEKCALCGTVLRDYQVVFDELKIVLYNYKELRKVYDESIEDLYSSSKKLESDITLLTSSSTDIYNDLKSVLDLVNEQIKVLVPKDVKDVAEYDNVYKIGCELLDKPTNNVYIIQESVTSNKAYIKMLESKIQDIELLKDVLKDLSSSVKKIIKTKK